MLEKIEIKNFQSHKHSILDLHRGINVITGTSDVGKSSIRRAIEWLQLNRPRGSAFIRNQAKGPTSIAMDLDGVKIKRTKSKSENSYQLDKNTFKVVGSDVPIEIAKFLNLDDVSIQGQHETYFLLQDTAGEVAKKLNKVAGFEIIDQIMKSIKSAITTNKTDIKYTNQHVVDLEENLKQYEHLDDTETQLATIQKTVEVHQEKENVVADIQHSLDELTNIQETIDDLDGWLLIDTLITPILEIVVDWNESKKQLDVLEEVLEDISSYKQRIRMLSDRADREEDVQGIVDLISTRNTQLQASQKLFMALQNIEKNKKLHTDLVNELTEHETRLNELLAKHKMCPMCGTKLTTKTAAYIKELV